MRNSGKHSIFIFFFFRFVFLRSFCVSFQRNFLEKETKTTFTHPYTETSTQNHWQQIREKQRVQYFAREQRILSDARQTHRITWPMTWMLKIPSFWWHLIRPTAPFPYPVGVLEIRIVATFSVPIINIDATQLIFGEIWTVWRWFWTFLRCITTWTCERYDAAWLIRFTLCLAQQSQVFVAKCEWQWGDTARTSNAITTEFYPRIAQHLFRIFWRCRSHCANNLQKQYKKTALREPKKLNANFFRRFFLLSLFRCFIYV